MSYFIHATPCNIYYFLDALSRPRSFEALLKSWANVHNLDANYEVGKGTAYW